MILVIIKRNFAKTGLYEHQENNLGSLSIAKLIKEDIQTYPILCYRWLVGPNKRETKGSDRRNGQSFHL